MMKFATRPLPPEEMLLHELNHRVNNEFAAAISVVSLAAARPGNDEVKATLSAVVELLHQYAKVHRALQMPEHDTLIDAAAYLRQLCHSISRSQLDRKKIKLVLSAQPLWLPADHCWRLGMIVFELINNAVRHAFLGAEGEIRVELLRAGAFAQCSVVDNGSAPATIVPGRGLKIIDALSDSLGGRLEQSFGPLGSTSILAFPCDSEPTVIPPREVQTLESDTEAFGEASSAVPCAEAKTAASTRTSRWASFDLR
jgi:two-component sensor histidine kinase